MFDPTKTVWLLIAKKHKYYTFNFFSAMNINKHIHPQKLKNVPFSLSSTSAWPSVPLQKTWKINHNYLKHSEEAPIRSSCAKSLSFQRKFQLPQLDVSYGKPQKVIPALSLFALTLIYQALLFMCSRYYIQAGTWSLEKWLELFTPWRLITSTE